MFFLIYILTFSPQRAPFNNKVILFMHLATKEKEINLNRSTKSQLTFLEHSPFIVLVREWKWFLVKCPFIKRD